MPTLCDPWPGKTKAIALIRPSVAGSRAEHGRSRCKVAWIRPGSYAQRHVRTTRSAALRPADCAAPGDRPDLRGGPLGAGRGRRRSGPRTRARSRSGWRWAGRSGASSSSASPRSSAACAWASPSWPPCTSWPTRARRPSSDLADAINRSPSATSRLVDGLVRRRLVERRIESEDRRQRSVELTQRGHALLRMVDRARADQFLVGGPADARRRTGPDRDGRRRPGDPRDLPPRPPDPGPPRVES